MRSLLILPCLSSMISRLSCNASFYACKWEAACCHERRSCSSCLMEFSSVPTCLDNPMFMSWRFRISASFACLSLRRWTQSSSSYRIYTHKDSFSFSTDQLMWLLSCKDFASLLKSISFILNSSTIALFSSRTQKYFSLLISVPLMIWSSRPIHHLSSSESYLLISDFSNCSYPTRSRSACSSRVSLEIKPCSLSLFCFRKWVSDLSLIRSSLSHSTWSWRTLMSCPALSLSLRI